MRIKAVIFDMDGLMLDTEPLHWSAWQRALAECGYPMPDANYTRLIGRTVADAEQMLLDEFGVAFPMSVFQTKRRELEAPLVSGLPPKKRGLDELLALFDSRCIPRAVATSTRREIATPLLTATGLLDGFHALATGDEVSSGKPAPDLFLLAAQRLGTEPATCLVLEDAESGVIAAHQAGMAVYMVPDLQRPSLTAERLANGIFDSLDAVASHLELTLQQFDS